MEYDTDPMITDAIFDCKYRFTGIYEDLSSFKGEFIAITACMQPMDGLPPQLRLTLRSLETGKHISAYISDLVAIIEPPDCNADDEEDEEYDRQARVKTGEKKSFFDFFKFF